MAALLDSLWWAWGALPGGGDSLATSSRSKLDNQANHKTRITPSRYMRLEYSVNIGGTKSYRFAMNKSLAGRGCNAQTLPKALRYYLVPSPDRIFVSGDLSQAEARVVAYLANCKDLIALFADPKRHLHQETALVIFGHTVEPDSPEYVLAKAVVHASNYREGPHRFSVQTGLPVAQTKKLLEIYHSKRPEIRHWHKFVWDEIARCGMLRSPLGDERVFYAAISCFSLTGKMTDQQWKDAIAWVPQTTVPHITNLGLLDMQQQQDELDIWFHHQGHDSFLVSVPVGNAKAVVELAKKAFCIPLMASGRQFVIGMEFSSGFNFGDLWKWDGHEPTREEWQDWLTKKLAKKSREARILEATYGVHLKGWQVGQTLYLDQ